MDPYSLNLNSWNKASSLYRQRFMDPGIYQEGYDTLLNLLNEKHSSLLDVACGPGNISTYLHQRHHFAKIVCTDFAENMLKELNPELSFEMISNDRH
ncbi:MAG: class I SAM-dependent methyltransferase [Saprospiraceae bacterium]|mgnify:CR=1 FL=1